MAPGVARKSLAAYGVFFLIFFTILLGSHASVLELPYFWDELGQFVPAALDIYTQGSWVPKSTLPNVHPPGVMGYLAGVWTIAGYSIPITRIAMLLLAAAGVLAVFALAIELTKPLSGAPALLAVLLLLASPLFWAQSMMVQLDMPAMVFTALALVLFLKEKYIACAVASALLVLMKETSIVVPALFGALLLWERRFRSALLFLIPAAALAIWLAVLYSATGHIFGNREFTHYNITFQIHPIRLPVTVVRRAFYLFVDNFHWVGTIAVVIALKKSRIFQSRAWGVVGAVAVLQTVVVSVLGGAALERYMMPVIPLFYIAVAAAWTTFSVSWRRISAIAMTAGLIAGIFISSPFPFPFENNSAFVTFVRLQQRAAQFVSAEYPRSTVVSAWPFPDALRRPEFGFVKRCMRVQGIENFNPETLLRLKGNIDVLVVYSRTWEPTWGVLRSQVIRQFLADYYHYSPQISEVQIQRELGLIPVARWQDGEQWIEVYARRRPRSVLIL